MKEGHTRQARGSQIAQADDITAVVIECKRQLHNKQYRCFNQAKYKNMRDVHERLDAILKSSPMWRRT